jgi:hypothetical protein
MARRRWNAGRQIGTGRTGMSTCGRKPEAMNTTTTAVRTTFGLSFQQVP